MLSASSEIPPKSSIADAKKSAKKTKADKDKAEKAVADAKGLIIAFDGEEVRRLRMLHPS